MELIYIVDAVKQVMSDLSMDSKKILIEKISRPQFLRANKVLQEIFGLIGEFDLPHGFVEASNRCFGLILWNRI